MDAIIERRYRRQRRSESYPWATTASHALLVARQQSKPGIDWDGVNQYRFEQDGFNMVATWRYDDYYDADDMSPLTFDEAYEYMRTMGASKSVAGEKAREAVRRYESERREAFAVIVTVKAYRQGIELGRDSLSGIELGDRGAGDPYMIDVVSDVSVEAVSEARAALARLCPALV